MKLNRFFPLPFLTLALVALVVSGTAHGQTPGRWPRTPSQQTLSGRGGYTPSSQARKPPGYADHHLLPFSQRNHPVLQGGFQINSRSNRMLLPQQPSTAPNSRAAHPPGFSADHRAYNQQTKAHLDSIQRQPPSTWSSSVRQYQNQLRRDIRTGKTRF
jgi:hypothetical protein